MKYEAKGKCDNCGDEPVGTVRVGEPEDAHESRTADVCRKCLFGALDLLNSCDAQACEHNVRDGDFCPDCNAAHKEARRENGDDEKATKEDRADIEAAKAALADPDRIPLEEFRARMGLDRTDTDYTAKPTEGGYRDAEDGRPFDSNPWPLGSNESHAWKLGWRDWHNDHPEGT